jgi:hypothetical protein
MPFGDNDARVRLRANGTDFIKRGTFEQLFGCETAKSISTAYEEQLFDGKDRHDWTRPSSNDAKRIAAYL